ncbi:hypothetical protein AJ88_28445 [Mesorhizobium amorphae CCBAU 01583]|nr:hypothetical protein AJ88_28445 [Mesorhizobium amorphae CCBAU 01583]
MAFEAVLCITAACRRLGEDAAADILGIATAGMELAAGWTPQHARNLALDLDAVENSIWIGHWIGREQGLRIRMVRVVENTFG